MKLVKLAHPLAVCAALSLTVIGCRKGLDKTTHIPKGSQPITESAAGPRDPGNSQPIAPTPTDTTGTTTPVTGSTISDKAGIAATELDFSTWTENRDEFKAQTVYFEFDKSNIKPGEVGKLEEVARRMKSSFQDKALRIEGHCDERGTEEYNRALGDRRALSVREKLVQLGLDPKMIPTISYGEERPADMGHGEAAWSKNRRGELILLTRPAN